MEPPILYTLKDALALSGLGKTKLYELIGDGTVEAVKSGVRTMIVGDKFRAYLAALPRAAIQMKSRPRPDRGETNTRTALPDSLPSQRPNPAPSVGSVLPDRS